MATEAENRAKLAAHYKQKAAERARRSEDELAWDFNSPQRGIERNTQAIARELARIAVALEALAESRR